MLLCGTLARPEVVRFDDKPYELDGLLRHACLVIGTSSTVRADDCNFLSVINLSWSPFGDGTSSNMHMIALNVAVEKWRCSTSSLTQVNAMPT